MARAARAEWRLLSRERGFWVILAVLAALILYGAQVGAGWARHQHRVIAEATAHEREALTALREALTHGGDAGTDVASRPGWAPLFRYAILPPSPLMALAVGQSDLQPPVIQVGLESLHLASYEELENPHNLFAGRFDVAFVVVYLLPLAVLLTGAGTLTREREAGTLPLAIASAGSASALALGKAVARGVLGLAVTCAAIVLAFLLSGPGTLKSDTVARIALWLLVACAYGFFWWTIALLLDFLAAPGTTKTVAAIVIWAAVVWVVPGLLYLAAKASHPVPGRTEQILEAREAWRQLAPHADQLLASLYRDRPDLSPSTGLARRPDPVAAHHAVQLELERRLKPMLDAHESQRTRQHALAARLAYLSPAALAHDSLVAVAGTGRPGHEAFLRDTERLHQQWRSLLLPMIFRGERLSHAHHEMLPRFASRVVPSPTVGTLAGPLAGILLPALAAVALALRTLRRSGIVPGRARNVTAAGI